MQWRYSIVFVLMFLVYGISFHFYGILCMTFLATGLAAASVRLREAVHEKNWRNALMSLASCVLHFGAVAFFLDWDRIVLNAMSLGHVRSLIGAVSSSSANDWQVSRENVIFPHSMESVTRISMGLPSVTERALLGGRIGE